MKKLLKIMLPLLVCLILLAACAAREKDVPRDIVIVYTNDIHCALEENTGFSSLSAYVRSLRERGDYVTLVDCGDAIQGSYIGTISKGEYIVGIMNEVGYDLAVLGNHEFDYGMDRLKALIDKSNATYLGCNLTYSGKGENALSAVKPYEIRSYGDTKVAYIGVTTPSTVTSSTPAYFMEDGEYVYGFTDGQDGAALYACVQGYVDECRTAGADYVILLTHLGNDEEISAYSSVALLQNTDGVDACLDAHAHNQIACRIEHNLRGEDVLLSSTGTKFATFGQLLISPDGTLTTTLISHYEQRDADIDAYIAGIEAGYADEIAAVVATSDMRLSCTDDDGIRLVRNRETTIGDLCADAYRAITGADIALVNGGGIRADLPQGDITYADILSIHPYGNLLCVAEVTGQQILDCLEMSYRDTQAQYAENGLAVGESGAFQQVSGLRLRIDTSIPSGVVTDENGEFVRVDGARRVQDVFVQCGDEYVPLDPEATYTLASHNYLIKNSGNGLNMFRDCKLLIDEGILDYQVLIDYITGVLGGKVGERYASVEGRITID